MSIIISILIFAFIILDFTRLIDNFINIVTVGFIIIYLNH